MATRMLLKAKPDPKLPLQFLRSRISVLTRPVSPIAQPESTNESPQLSLNRASTFPMSLGIYQKPFSGVGFSLAGGALFARHMGAGPSSSRPGGGSSRDDEDDDFDEDVDGVDDFGGDVDDDDDLDMDDIDEEEDEEEIPKRRKTNKRY